MSVLLESAAMKRSRNLVAVLSGAMVLVVLSGGVASAQIDVSATPQINNSPLGPLGPLPSLAALMGVLGLLVVVVILIRYMRYSPRFARDEESKVVRADRVQPGRELPRRAVDLSKAAPVIVAPPNVPVAVGAVATPVAPVAAVAAAALAAVAAPATTPAPAPAAADSPAPAPAAAAIAPPAAAPAASAIAPPAAAPAPPAPAPERREVTMDQAVFEQTLKELLDAGTDRRIAEGKARRTAMIAAKKAAGEG